MSRFPTACDRSPQWCSPPARDDSSPAPAVPVSPRSILRFAVTHSALLCPPADTPADESPRRFANARALAEWHVSSSRYISNPLSAAKRNRPLVRPIASTSLNPCIPDQTPRSFPLQKPFLDLP